MSVMVLKHDSPRWQAYVVASISWNLFCILSFLLFLHLALMIVSGIFVNGPYGLITTAVSANLVSCEFLIMLRYRNAVLSSLNQSRI